MKSRATPSVARITGQAMVKSFFTSSPSPWADLIGGMVPRAEHGRSALPRAPCLGGAAPAPTLPLTAVVVQRGELRGLVAAAGAVAGLHAELVPRGLAQLRQEDLTGAVGAEALPDPVALGPVLQDNGGDGAAPAAPALQVQPGMRGVDVGEEVLVLAEGGLCGRGAVRRAAAERGPLRRGTTVGPGHCGAGSPLPWVLASMISLMRPAPTLFLAASFTLYQVPHLRLSSLKERSEELMNTSFHSSLLSTEYWSTKPVGARVGWSPLGTQAAGAGDRHPGRAREGVTAGTQSQRGTLRPPRGTSRGHVCCSARAAITHRFLPDGDGNAALYSCAADVGYGYLKTASRDELLPCWTLRVARTEADSPAGTACSADPGRSHRREACGHPQQLATS